MRHQSFPAAALLFVALSATGCDPKLFAQFTGANNLAGSQPPEQTPSASPSAAVPTPSPTIASKQNVLLTLVRDYYYTAFSVYVSPYFDLATGTDSTASDHGQLEFTSRSGGILSSEDSGNFIYGRQYVSKQVVLGFIDKGTAGFDSIAEAPEFGWSAAPVGQRNKVKVTPGNTYLIRAQYPSTNATFYGKVWVKDWSGAKVTFDYVWQTATGSRTL